MSDDLSNDQLRAISPFLVKDANALLFADGQLKRARVTLSLHRIEDFANNATEWEKENCPLLTGTTKWTAIIDDAETIIAYSGIFIDTGIYHLKVRELNGELLVDQILGEEPLEPDPLGDTLAATIVTLGGALLVRTLAAGIARVAAAAIASGARIVSLAASRVLAGQSTEGVVLTALRSVRAQAIVKSLQGRGIPVIVNIGGEGGLEELSRWGAEQIALNHQVRMGIATRFVPNLVKARGEQIGEVFAPNTIDKVVSRRLDISIDANKVATSTFQVLKSGGTIEMEFFVGNPAFEAAFTNALRNAGFRNVRSLFGVRFTAIK